MDRMIEMKLRSKSTDGGGDDDFYILPTFHVYGQ